MEVIWQNIIFWLQHLQKSDQTADKEGKKIRLNITKPQQIIRNKNMINQPLTDSLKLSGSQINTLRWETLVFFFNYWTILKGEKGPWRLKMGVLTVIFCGICCHQVPRLWTVCPCWRSLAMIEEEASRKSSLPSCGGKKSRSSSPGTAPQNRPFFIPACMRGCAHDTVGKTRCVQLRKFLFWVLYRWVGDWWRLSRLMELEGKSKRSTVGVLWAGREQAWDVF